ncbi:MAG: 2-C-methyl-D-erythritol 4-phosphate cytidylyltransferase [Pirellulaceae bacterium]
MPSFAVILPAAGKSSRFRDPFEKKPFVSLEGRPVWACAAEPFVGRSDVRQTLLVIAPEDRQHFQEQFATQAAMLGIELVEGGAERSDSVAAALARIGPTIDFVAIHDAARPCLTSESIDAVFAAAIQTGAALLATPIRGTIKRVGKDQTVVETLSREGLWEAQTPQVFARQLLLDAYARRGALAATDDAQLVERLGHAVTIVAGSPLNLKVTTQEDLRMAAAVLRSQSSVGSGLSIFTLQGS